MVPTLLRVHEVARRLDVTEARVYELARQGLLPGTVRIGRQVRFDPAAVEQFIRTGGQPLEGGWRRAASD